MQKKIIFVLVSLLLVFFGMSLYFLVSNLSLKKSLKEIPKIEEIERKINLEGRRLKKALERNLEQKSRADRVSYRAMIKRLELEKKKQEELKGKIEQLEKGVNKK